MFIIKNIFTELVEETEELTLYMVQMGERMVAVINFDYPAMEQIQDKIQRTQDMIEEKFCQQVIALVGNSYGSQREIFKSYEDTCELEDYISILEERIICYQDIQGRQQTYRYDAQMSQKLFNAIKAGNRDIAVEQVKDILGQYRQKDVAFGVYRSLLFDILGTILRAADAGGYHELMEDSIQVEALLSNLTLKRMERTFTELIGMACQRISSLQQGAGPGSELSCKVEKYVLENFRDPDLNISQTGLHFQMSPSYLSSIYKQRSFFTISIIQQTSSSFHIPTVCSNSYSINTREPILTMTAGSFLSLFQAGPWNAYQSKIRVLFASGCNPGTHVTLR